MIELPTGIRPDLRSVELGNDSPVHLIGIGGAGMSAIAAVLSSIGHPVAGSDLKDSASLDTLRASGIDVTVGHDAANLASGDLIVARSTAIPDRNTEVVAAIDRGLPVYSRAEILSAITRLRSTISVAGTHGKTTTSSMLAVVLRHVGASPSFIIGGEVNEIGSGAVWDRGDFLVVEADESDGTFLALDSSSAIVTSVEPDHLDLYGDAATVRMAFAAFLEAVDGPKVVCIDDPDAADVAAQVDSVTYGTNPDALVRITGFEQRRAGASFRLESDRFEPLDVSIAAPGLHNARNATGALLLAVEHGFAPEAAAEGLRRYAGVSRRYEFRGEAAGVTFVDDYAHLPSEVEVTIAATADGGYDRVVAVFQPHRYSRTGALGATFGPSFRGADLVVVTDIYSAGEHPVPGVSGRLVADAVAADADSPEVVWLPHRSDLVGYLRNELRDGDLCLTLGAGDLTSLPDELIAVMGERA